MAGSTSAAAPPSALDGAASHAAALVAAGAVSTSGNEQEPQGLQVSTVSLASLT